MQLIKKLLLLLPVTTISLFFVFSPGHAFAAYDPNMVISDAQLTARGTMTEAQIQDFLVAKGSYLANFTIPAARTVTYYVSSTKTLTTYENTIIGPYGASTEVNVAGWKASRVIWQVSQWYGVNPQVLLSIIEKESSYITRTDGAAQSSVSTLLDGNGNPYLMGANDYASYAWIMGYSYTESGAKNTCGTATIDPRTGVSINPTSSCAGLAAQLDNAGWAVVNWKDLANNRTGYSGYSCAIDTNGDGINDQFWSGNYWTNYSTKLCEGSWINPQSGATAALYRYTPHTGLTGGYAGNRAFYLIFSNWFSSDGAIRLSSSLVLSNYVPAVGETQSNTFTIKNYNAYKVTLDKVVIAARDPYGNNVDFNVHSGVALDTYGTAGDSFSSTDTRIFTKEGVHAVWVSYYYQGAWKTIPTDAGMTNYMTFAVHKPNLSVTGFSFNPFPGTAGQEMSATYVIKNNEPKPIYVDVLSVGNKLTTQPWLSQDFGGYTGITIPAGQTTAPLTVRRTFSTPGLYVATVYARTGDYWSELNWGNGVSSKSYYWVAPYADSIRALQSLAISNNSPAIGETVSASSLRIRNKSAATIVLDKLVVTGRNSAWETKDFPVQTNITLAPYGDSAVNDWYIMPTLDAVFAKEGTYTFWVSYLYGGSWYDVKPDTNQTVKLSVAVHKPNLSVTGFSFNPFPGTAGQEMSATYVIKNNEPKPIYVDVLSVGNKLTTQPWLSQDFGGYTGITIPAGQTTAPLTVRRTFSTPGLYVATVYARTGDYWSELNWGNGVSSKSYYWVK